MSRKNWERVFTTLSLGLIGLGLFMIYIPACPLGLGLLLWTSMVLSPSKTARVAKKVKKK